MITLGIVFVFFLLMKKISDLVWEREQVKRKLGESNYNYLTKRDEK